MMLYLFVNKRINGSASRGNVVVFVFCFLFEREVGEVGKQGLVFHYRGGNLILEFWPFGSVSAQLSAPDVLPI